MPRNQAQALMHSKHLLYHRASTPISYLFLLDYFILWVWVFCLLVHHVHAWWLAEIRRGHRILWNWSYDGCEPPVGCWELIPCPLQKHHLPLAAKPSLQPPNLLLFNSRWSLAIPAYPCICLCLPCFFPFLSCCGLLMDALTEHWQPPTCKFISFLIASASICILNLSVSVMAFTVRT